MISALSEVGLYWFVYIKFIKNCKLSILIHCKTRVKMKLKSAKFCKQIENVHNSKKSKILF